MFFVFDLFHTGHLNILRNAKSSCDKLIVGISSSKLVREVKKIKLVNTFNERKQIVSSIKYVDKVVTQTNYNKLEAWKKYKFNKMYVGDDWKGTKRWIQIENQFKNLDVEIIYLNYTTNISSSFLKRYINNFNENYYIT